MWGGSFRFSCTLLGLLSLWSLWTRCAVGEDVGVAAARCCVCGGKTYFGMPRQEQQQLPVLQSGASFAAGAGFGQAVRQDADNVAARCERGEHGGFVHPRALPLMGMRAAAMVKIRQNR